MMRTVDNETDNSSQASADKAHFALSQSNRSGVALAILTSLIIAGCSLTKPKPTNYPKPLPPSLPGTPTAPTEVLKPLSATPTRPSDKELLALPDPVVKAEPKARLGNPVSYVALGQRYTVLNSAHGYVERGVASWYGPNFHGEKASIGEPYDMYGLTGAHRVLPLPCYARVTNLKNGRSVVVRLNDRGPFKDNRIVDLSYTAALKLDMLREGTALVELRVLEPDQRDPGAAAVLKTERLLAQVGAFADQTNAVRAKKNLESRGFSNISIVAESSSNQTLWKVRLGPIESVSGYDTLVAKLHAAGFASVSLVDGAKLSPNSHTR